MNRATPTFPVSCLIPKLLHIFGRPPFYTHSGIAIFDINEDKMKKSTIKMYVSSLSSLSSSPSYHNKIAIDDWLRKYPYLFQTIKVLQEIVSQSPRRDPKTT